MEQMDHQDRPRRAVAIVTGASSGIGAATARLLAAEGFDVGITFNRNAGGACDTVAAVEAAGARAASVPLDLVDHRAGPAAIDALAERLGGVDVLVNNAGVNPRATTLDADAEVWEQTLGANLIGPWACVQAAARHMIAAGAGGRIVNVTSILATTPLSGGGPYCAAKAGLDLLTKVMALELAPHGIAVNAVAPGHTATPMNYAADVLDGATEPIARPVIPLGRAAAPEEVARAIVFLATGAGSYVTGSSLLVDGGLALASGPEELQAATGLPESAR
jgi:NAD(P)-dependent dehydrogenase (short-subunit alcohol dehydrogenase family)